MPFFYITIIRVYSRPKPPNDILIALEKGNEQRREVAKDTKVYAYTQTGTRKHGSLRRSAHDLKEVLTLITQNRDI